MDNKPFWESKTIWVNAALAAATTFAQSIGAALPPEVVAIGIPLVNVLLRLVTKKRVTLGG